MIVKWLHVSLSCLLTLFQEKAKELRLKEFMEQQLENKDKQLEKLVARQQSVSADCAKFPLNTYILLLGPFHTGNFYFKNQANFVNQVF